MKPNFRNYRIAGLKSKVLKKRIFKYLLDCKMVDVLQVHDYILSQIKQLNCVPAFPPNINGPSIVAHDTADVVQNRVFTEGLITIDVGVIYKGCIIDTAFLFVLNKPELEYLHKINATFFENLKSILKPGLEIKKISQYIETYYKQNNLFVINELMGHTIKPPILHTEPFIPSSSHLDIRWSKLYEGQVFTIEPHLAMSPSSIVYNRPKIYGLKTNFYSVRTNPIINPLFVELYPVIALKDPIESFSEQHTFFVRNNEVIQLT